MKNSKIEIGDLVQDTITPFKGLVVATLKYRTGCRRLLVQSNGLGEDGKRVDETFSEIDLKIVKKGAWSVVEIGPARVENGDEVQSDISGFKGIVTCEIRWRDGTYRLMVQGVKQKDAKDEAKGFDEDELKVIKKGAKIIALKEVVGGPKDTPQGIRPEIPSR